MRHFSSAHTCLSSPCHTRRLLPLVSTRALPQDVTTSTPNQYKKNSSVARASRANAVVRPLVLLSALFGILLLGGLIALFAAQSLAFVCALDHHALGLLATLLGNTLLTSVVALVVAVPIGLFAALYLTEFASVRVRALLEPILRFFASLPSVVYGYFAVSTLLPALGAVLPCLDKQYALGAGLALACMMVPTFLEHARAGIRAVPEHLRDGACALGGTKFATALFVVVPAARVRLVAALVLAASRAIGETMIVLVVLSAQAPGQTATSDTLATYVARFGTADADMPVLFLVGSVLLVVAFALDGLHRSLDKPAPRGASR